MIFGGSAHSNSSTRISGSKLWRALLYIVGIALYLNIGWALGAWYHDNVRYEESDTFVEKVAAGGWDILNESDTPEEQRRSKGNTIFLFYAFWPVVLFVSVGSWIVFGLWHLLWLIFGGGIAKLLGVG